MSKYIRLCCMQHRSVGAFFLPGACVFIQCLMAALSDLIWNSRQAFSESLSKAPLSLLRASIREHRRILLTLSSVLMWVCVCWPISASISIFLLVAPMSLSLGFNATNTFIVICVNGFPIWQGSVSDYSWGGEHISNSMTFRCRSSNEVWRFKSCKAMTFALCCRIF